MVQERADLFELLNLAVTVTDLRTGRLRRANAAACDLLGRSEDELVGTYWQDVTVPEERALWHEEIHRPGRHDPPSRRLVRLWRPDHSTVHVLVTSATVPGPAGRQILSQLQDVSDEITANDRLRLILDNTPVSMFLVDRSGFVLASEGLMDATLSRLAEHPDVSVFTLFEDLPDALGLLQAALAGRPLHHVIEAFGRCFDLHLMPIEGPEGEVSYLTCVATDVTEHQQALATLRTRSVEQAMVADLGQQALESRDAASMWTRAARTLAEHLAAGTVRIHELAETFILPTTSSASACSKTAARVVSAFFNRSLSSARCLRASAAFSRAAALCSGVRGGRGTGTPPQFGDRAAQTSEEVAPRSSLGHNTLMRTYCPHKRRL